MALNARSASRRRRGRTKRAILNNRNLWSLGLLISVLALIFLAWQLSIHVLHVLGLACILGAGLSFAWKANTGGLCWLIVATAFLLPYFATFFPDRSLVAGCRFTVMTFNAKVDESQNVSKVAAMLAQARPDLALLQETNRGTTFADAVAATPELAGWSSITVPDTGFTLVSRFPLSNATWNNTVMTGVATIAGKTVRLVTGRAPRLAAGAADAEFTNYFRVLENLAAPRGGPVIMGLDLNAGPLSGSVASLSNALDDAYARSGFGIGATFPSPRRLLGALGAFIRMDYIFSSGEFVTDTARVLPDYAGSTHYPVMATLVFRGTGANGEPCR